MVAPLLNNKTNHSPPCFLSCDWGTSSFRLKLVTSDTAKVLDGLTDNSGGIREMYNRWTGYHGSMSRVDFYLSFLNDKITELGKKSSSDLTRMPVVLSGMASSSIGIKELPYARLPVLLEKPALNTEMIKARETFPRDLYLISGIRSSEDVMRGEETELLGLATKLNFRDGLFLLVGTHSKHIWIQEHAITQFKTFMTGELFELISSKSILSNSVAANNNTKPGKAFKKGIKTSLNGNLLHSLFTIRARDLIERTDQTVNYDYLSGLLIGTELKELVSYESEQVILWGSSRLRRYYAAALEVLKLEFVQPDIRKDEDITSLGQRIIIEKMNN